MTGDLLPEWTNDSKVETHGHNTNSSMVEEPKGDDDLSPIHCQSQKQKSTEQSHEQEMTVVSNPLMGPMRLWKSYLHALPVNQALER